MRSLQGEFSTHIKTLSEALIALRVNVEVALDFADEDIDFLADAALIQQCADLQTQVDTCLGSAEQGVLLTEGMTVVIAGAAECRQIEPDQLSRRLRGRDRHRRPGHHPRCPA